MLDGVIPKHLHMEYVCPNYIYIYIPMRYLDPEGLGIVSGGPST